MGGRRCAAWRSTALLGIALILTGRLKLASLVQYLPLPVIGGYLAYIGLYCGLAGLGLMANADVQHPQVRLLGPFRPFGSFGSFGFFGYRDTISCPISPDVW